MKIDIHFDVVCPWCFIGHRRLGLALRERPQLHPAVAWRPYFLNPDLPDEGIPFDLYVERKFGGARRAQRLLTSLAEVGRVAGIAFDFAAIRRTPNTLNAHRLVRLARSADRQTEITAALFDAYFCRGRDIGDRDVLRDIGMAQGLSPAHIEAAFADAGMAESLRAEAEATQRSGAMGVPLFVLNDRFAIIGAQEAEVLIRLLDVAASDDRREGWPFANFSSTNPPYPPAPA